MTLANSDILTYILANRLFVEDGEYLLQEKVETAGRDAIGSARAWLFGRFFGAGETTLYTAWNTATFTDLISANLTELSAVRAAYLVITGDQETTDIYMMLFEAFIRLGTAYIWDVARMDGDVKTAKKEAQEFITALVGAKANPDNVLGGANGSGNDAALGAVVTTDAWTDAEITDELGGYE